MHIEPYICRQSNNFIQVFFTEFILKPSRIPLDNNHREVKSKYFAHHHGKYSLYIQNGRHEN